MHRPCKALSQLVLRSSRIICAGTILPLLSYTSGGSWCTPRRTVHQLTVLLQLLVSHRDNRPCQRHAADQLTVDRHNIRITGIKSSSIWSHQQLNLIWQTEGVELLLKKRKQTPCKSQPLRRFPRGSARHQTPHAKSTNRGKVCRRDRVIIRVLNDSHPEH